MVEHIAGIDYSISGPSVCVHPKGVEWNIDNCKMFSVCSVKKRQGLFLNDSIEIIPPIKDYAYDIDRFNRMALNFLDFLKKYNVKTVMIEGYAYAASGPTFSIGEATGLVKYHIAEEGLSLLAETPPVFKKYATGKGNANKDKMVAAFKEDTGVDLMDVFKFTTDKINSPVDNLVDSYWICKYASENSL